MKFNIRQLAAAAALPMVMTLSAFTGAPRPKADSKIMFKGGGDTVVVMTEKLTEDVFGYIDIVPLKLSFVRTKLAKIDVLPNEETPRYMKQVEDALLPKWEGKEIDQILQMQVDGVSGATYTADAVKEGVIRGTKYRKTHDL